MSTEKKTGGPAFPTDNEHQTGPHTYHSEGMTLRDYFAAKALTGIIASSPNAGSEHIPVAAKTAYAIADAMLKAREQ